MIEVDAHKIRDLLNYEPLTGVFTWKVRRGGKAVAGSTAGRLDRCGYSVIRIDGRCMMAHRLAYLYIHGVLPELEIDHINGIRSDNRIENLRLATRSENQQNLRQPRQNNKSGFLGVHLLKGKYVATIVRDKKSKYLGSFDDPESAHKAYINAKQVIHPYGVLK
jgi:hypothetical protein